jgi:hypothetical protein
VKYGELFQDDSQQMDVVDVSCDEKMIADSKVGASSSSVFRGLHCFRLAASHPALVPVPMMQALGASTKLCSLVEGLRRTSIEDSGKLLALHSLLMTYGIHAGSNATHSSDSTFMPSVDEASPAKAVIFAQSNGILDCVADGMFARAPFKGIPFLRLIADKSAMNCGRIAATKMPPSGYYFPLPRPTASVLIYPQSTSFFSWSIRGTLWSTCRPWTGRIALVRPGR